MDEKKSDTLSEKLLAEAAEWHVRMTSDTVSDSDIERHMDWLLGNPLHADAYEIVASTVRDATDFEPQARVRFADDFAGGIDRQTPASFLHKLLPKWEWPQVATALAVAAAVAFISVLPLTSFYDAPEAEHIYSADARAVKQIKLADGSRVSLMPGATISSRMLADKREVSLKGGRAFFEVVSDKSKPFYVDTGQRLVRVVGTRFEVYAAADFDRVAVNEGLVSVSDKRAAAEGTPRAGIMIEPGMVALYQDGKEDPQISMKSPDQVGAWASGVLVFSDSRLGEVMQEIHQLHPEKPIALDPSLADRTYSGTIAIADAETMLRHLTNLLSLTLTVTDSEFIVTAR
ncbi:FecR family protein [Kordiimonas aestuarii]|uniref:FecR family protein n=1 Tax=Kordiimonas aestuarii TaxID=1005925 RepID=UPI0021CF3533|nr:FecR domain-containing protein [Kordiimonas aestuarii]